MRKRFVAGLLAVVMVVASLQTQTVNVLAKELYQETETDEAASGMEEGVESESGTRDEESAADDVGSESGTQEGESSADDTESESGAQGEESDAEAAGEDEVTEAPEETDQESEEESGSAEMTVMSLETSEDDIASGSYTENGSDVSWVIDANGKLTVEGTGEFADTGRDVSENDKTPWQSEADSIISAEIKVTGMTDASYMFYNCSKLVSVNLSDFDTSALTNMQSMFAGCSSLTGLDVSGFKTSKVSDMAYMFSGCSSLTSLDVRGFDTSQVTYMDGMFEGCSSLTSLDLSGFDTSQVTQMETMFKGCSSLTDLDLSRFNTSHVTNMAYMFSGCSSLAGLDVSGFDTSYVSLMWNMFSGCSSLTSLDLSSFDMNGVRHQDRPMFVGCSSLSLIYTPYNIPDEELEIFYQLPQNTVSDVWYDCDGNEYTRLPVNLSYSIVLMRNSKPSVSTLSATKGKKFYTPGETLNLDDLSVYYYDDKGAVVHVTEGYTTNAAEIDMTAPGRKILKITYNDLTTEVEIVVGTVYTVIFNGTGKDDVSAETQNWALENAEYKFTLAKKDGYTYTVTAVMGEESITPTADETDSVYTIANVTANLVITIDKTANQSSDEDRYVKFVVYNNAPIFAIADSNIKPEKDEDGKDTNVYKLAKEEISELPFTLTIPYGYTLANKEDYFVDGRIIRRTGAREKSVDGSSWIYKYKVVADQIKSDMDPSVGTKENPYEIHINIINGADRETVCLTYAEGSKTAKYKSWGWPSWGEFIAVDAGTKVTWGDTVVLQVDEGQTLKVDGEEVTLDAVNKYSFIARLDDDADENASTHVIDVQDAAGDYKLGYAVNPDNTDTTYKTVGRNAVEVDFGSKVSLFLTDKGDDPVAISRCETNGTRSTVQKTGEKGKAEVEVKDENATVTLYVSAGEEEVEAARITLTSKDATGKILTVKGITKGKSVKLDAASVTSYALTLKDGKQTLHTADYDSALKVVVDQNKVKAAIADGKLTVEPLVAEQTEVKIQVAATNEDLFNFTVDGQTPALKVKSVTSANQGMHDILLNVVPDVGIKPVSYAFDLYYEVTVKQTAGTSTQQKNGTYYLGALNEEGDKIVAVSQLFKVNTETDNEKMENDYTFTVRLVAVENGEAVNQGNPSTGVVGTKLADADIKFATAPADIKPVSFKTRKGYYEDKLSVIKKTTKFPRWEDVVVAIPKFSKNAGHIDDIEAIVYDKNGSVVDDDEAYVEVDKDTMEVRMWARGIGNYDVVIYATASKVVDGDYDMYRASAKVPVTVMPRIDYIGVDGPTQVALLADSKGNRKDGSISLKPTGYYETWDVIGVKAPKQKFIYEMGETANPKNAGKVVVKNNKITVKKDFILGTDPDDNSFIVNVIANDYGTREENIANERYAPVKITVTDKALEIGAVQLVDDYSDRPLGANVLTTDLETARVKITDKNGQEIYPTEVTLTPNKGKIHVDTYGYVYVTGYQKDMTIKAVTRDGGKKSKSSIKYTVNYPEAVYSLGSYNDDYYYNSLTTNPAITNSTGLTRTADGWTYAGTGNSTISFNVIAKEDSRNGQNAAWGSADPKTYNYAVKVTGGKIINPKTDKTGWRYGQADGYYRITPNTDEVKVTITDKSVKPAKTYTFSIKDTNWQITAAPTASTKDKLYAARNAADGGLAIAQSLTYTVNAKGASYNAVKLSWVSGPDISADGTYTITDNSRFTLNASAATAGTAKYSAVYGSMTGDGTFEPKTKAATLSIKVNKAGTPKAVAKYTINPSESLSVPLGAKSAPVEGMVKFNKVLSANVKGQKNQFYDYFEVSADGKSLQIRSDKRSAADLKALAELGKDDLTGYVEYQYSIWRRTYSGDECATVVKRDRITVTIGSK